MSGLPIKLAGMLIGRKYYCSLCGKLIKGFKDRLSAKEFRITHTCQKCQDELFKPEKDEQEWDYRPYYGKNK